MGDNNIINLPPGFRFHPTDEELVVHFLYRKASLLPCYPDVIPDLDLYPHDPWELDGKALSSGNQWYFFSRMPENRVTKNGYWKELDIDEPIFTSVSKKVGIKKYLVFCIGEAPAGIETTWVMQEYCLCNRWLSNSSYIRRGNPKLDCSKWVLCRVHERKGDSQHGFCYNDNDDDDDEDDDDDDDDDDDGTELSYLDEMFLSLDDDFDEISLPN